MENLNGARVVVVVMVVLGVVVVVVVVVLVVVLGALVVAAWTLQRTLRAKSQESAALLKYSPRKKILHFLYVSF